jgi:23S rRNA (uracil1939-C5)-methyltransferase
LLLTIEKLIYGGDGLARLPADQHGRGKAVFVPFVLAGEEIEASVTEEKPGFARAQVDALLESSPDRILPQCPYFRSCGGCHYQHAGYEHQLQIKQEILRENLRRIAKLELECEIQVHPSPPWNYRNRSRLQVRAQPEFAAGYFKFSSHELLPVESCPISSPLINRGIAELWRAGRAGNIVEGLREVEFFANADDSRLMVECSCATEVRRAVMRAWAEELRAAMPEIVGVTAFRDTKKGAQEILFAIGAPDLTYQTRNAAYRVSAGAFFQTNRFLIDELVDTVTGGRSDELALDLYAGVGLFSTALACNFRHIISVESSQTSTEDLQHNLPVNGKAVRAEAGRYLEIMASAGAQSSFVGAGKSPVHSHRYAKKGRDRTGALPQKIPGKPDLIVVDPPRSGLGESVVDLLASLGAPRVTYVSCDPATLARDLRRLMAAGYRLEEAHLLDLFPQTYHLESVLQLVR